jgi:peptide/nickel transport system substrate-binding protein
MRDLLQQHIGSGDTGAARIFQAVGDSAIPARSLGLAGVRLAALVLSLMVPAFCGIPGAAAGPAGRPEIVSTGQAVPGATERERSKSNRVLRFGVHVSGMGHLDPHFAAGSQDRALADMVFNGLLRYQPGNAPKIEPDLAAAIPEFQMAAGRQVWTVKLRRGVMFHPGPETPAYEMTAQDVAGSLKKSADSRFCAYAGEYVGMSFIAVDRYTVQITLEKPLSPILFLPKLTNYAGGFIVSQRAIEKMGYEKFKNHPVGTGPFVFKSYRPGEKLTLTANAHYFRGRPKLDGVEIFFLPDLHTREAALEAGELDVITGSGEKGWPEMMEHQKGIIIDAHGVGEVATIYFNTEMKPLNDIRVRKAMAYALNRREFLDTVSQRIGGAVYSPVPDRFLPGGLTDQEVHAIGLAYDTDLEKARHLLLEAGYPDGFALNLVTSEKRLYRTYYAVLRKQLGRIGIVCHVKTVSHSQMHKQIRHTPMPIVIYVAWRPNADIYLSSFFSSDAVVMTGAHADTNFSHYRKIDRLIEAARLEIDPTKQINLWKQAQIRILDDMAAYPIMYTIQCYARRANVDYGHPLVSTMALYPQFTEQTRLNGP